MESTTTEVVQVAVSPLELVRQGLMRDIAGWREALFLIDGFFPELMTEVRARIYGDNAGVPRSDEDQAVDAAIDKLRIRLKSGIDANTENLNRINGTLTAQ